MAPDTPDTPTLTLTAAVIAAERGDAATAARAYMGVAVRAAALGEDDDADLARLAAARQWLRAGDTEAARPLLEAVLEAHPDDARASELFQACKTDLTRPEALAEPPPPAAEIPAPAPAVVTPAPAVVAPAPSLSMTQPATVLSVALAEAELAESSNRPDAAASALRRALDLMPPRDAGRAELARRLAGAYDLLGDDDGALGALRQFLDTAGPGSAVAPAWRRLVELHARLGDPQAAARALIASADDARTGSSDEERGAALTAAAEILRKRLGLPEDAVMILERAIALAPRSVETLDALQTTAVESSNWERLADVLERKVDLVARGPVEQKDLLVQLAEVYDRQLQRAGRARDTHERALQLDPRFQPSLTWLARDAWCARRHGRGRRALRAARRHGAGRAAPAGRAARRDPRPPRHARAPRGRRRHRRARG